MVEEGSKELEQDVTTVKDMVERIHTKIDEFTDDVDKEFLKEMEDQLKVKKSFKSYFICKNQLWDIWLQKLFGQLISVKIWIIALITILLSVSLITSTQFAAILGIVMGMKGIFSVADVWKRGGTNGDIIDKV
jgi:hypothetical protein